MGGLSEKKEVRILVYLEVWMASYVYGWKLISQDCKKNEVLPRFELGLLDSKSRVIAITLQNH